jgi:hypothetical protein
MSRQEVQGHAQPETTALDGRREARHHRRSGSDSADDQRRCAGDTVFLRVSFMPGRSKRGVAP